MSSSRSHVTAHGAVGAVRFAPEAPESPASAWQLDEFEPLPAAPATAGVFGAQGAHEAREVALERHIAALEAQRDAAVAAAEQRGYAAGHTAGVAAGEGMALERVFGAMQALQEAAAEVRANEARWMTALEENVAALAVIVARQIIAREVRTGHEMVADLVRRALTEFPLDQSVRIRLNPIDLSVISTATSASGAPLEIAPHRDIAWLADPIIERGGCVVEGRDRIIDGRVDTALERAYRQLAKHDA